MHAARLRDTLRAQAGADPWELASAWSELTVTEMEPWYRTTLNYDRHRLAQAQAIIDGREFSSGNSEWNTTIAIQERGQTDPDLLRASLDIALLLRRADEVTGDPAIHALVDGSVPVGGREPPLGPSRAEFLAAIA
jgi:hypothetical protein